MATAEGEYGSDFEETMFCEPCNKEGNTVEADGFCSDCSDYLCSTCLKYHKRLAKDHTLFDKSNMPQDFCFERCAIHPNDLVKFYCPRCDYTACIECLPTNHQAECSEFKHIPSYMQSRDVYREFKEIKNSLKDVEEEASRTEAETGQKLKEVSLNSSDISKSIKCQKKCIKDHIDNQRIEIFTTLDEERSELIRQIDERQGRRKQQLFEQQMFINNKVDDEARQLDEQSKLYPKKVQNMAFNMANIRSKLESLTTDLETKERHGRKAELFMTTRKVKHSMKTLGKDIDDVREANKERCLCFRPNTDDISINAAESVSLGSLTEQSQQRDSEDAAKCQQRAFDTHSSTGTEMLSTTASAKNAVRVVKRDAITGKIETTESQSLSKRIPKKLKKRERAARRRSQLIDGTGNQYIDQKEDDISSSQSDVCSVSNYGIQYGSLQQNLDQYRTTGRNVIFKTDLNKL